ATSPTRRSSTSRPSTNGTPRSRPSSRSRARAASPPRATTWKASTRGRGPRTSGPTCSPERSVERAYEGGDRLHFLRRHVRRNGVHDGVVGGALSRSEIAQLRRDVGGELPGEARHAFGALRALAMTAGAGGHLGCAAALLVDVPASRREAGVDGYVRFGPLPAEVEGDRAHVVGRQAGHHRPH